MDKRAVFATTLTLLLISMLTLALNIQPVKASGTIYIRPDGTVEGTDEIQRDGDVYTFTDNIYDSIVVEKDNIVIDGAGYIVQGTGAVGSRGIQLWWRSNVTLRNTKVTNFWKGVELSRSINITLVGNKFSSNNRAGINLSYSSNNTVVDNNASNNINGIVLYESNNNTVVDNNASNNNDTGIVLPRSSNNNTLSGNNASNNGRYGIWLSDSSDNNFLSDNTISNNQVGIYFDATYWNGSSNSNKILHNNFINNTNQVYDISWDYPTSFSPSINNWDNGYPSGGNYWSDFAGVDLYGGPHQNETGSDGIGDTPYFIDEDNQDNYPLMGMFYDFSLWYGMTAICNSTIYDFHAGYIITKEGLKSSIDFNVVGPRDTTGFCRIIIPRDFMEGPYTVLVHNEEVDATELPISNSTHAFLYFNYPNFAHIKITESPPTPPVVKTTIDVDPGALNLKSKGKWISAYIELPEDYDMRGIDRTTVTLNDTIHVDPFWVDKPLESVIGDYDNDGITDLMVKFDRQALIEYIRTEGITEAEVTLAITGKANGKSFEATDTIKVIGQ